MESHPQEDSKSHQLLDLTCSKENGILEPDSSELHVLDLSRKSTAISTRAINTFCTTFPLIKTTDVLTSTFSTLPVDANKRKQEQPDDFTNTWKSDQFQNSIMTQEESSKNMKNEQIYNDQLSEINRINDSIKSRMITNYQNDYMNSSLLFTRLALPPNSCAVSPILPNLLTNDRIIPKTPVIKSPATASLAVESVTSVSPLEPRLSISSDTTKKMTRPFKAYPRDPITLSINSEQYYDHNLNLSYEEFRKMMMEHVNKVNGGTNSKMRRVTNNSGSPTSTVEEKDAAYWERRKKNNEAAKRSRDARRAKEDEIAIRVAFLEQENMRLKCLIRKIFKETEDRNIHLNTLTVHEVKDYLALEL